MKTKPDEQPAPLEYAKPERANPIAQIGVFLGLVAIPLCLSIALSLLAWQVLANLGPRWLMLPVLVGIGALTVAIVRVFAGRQRGRMKRGVLLAGAIIGLGLAALVLTTCGALTLS